MSEHEAAQSANLRDPIFCPTNAVLNLLSGRWTLHIVRTLLNGRARFNEIARAQGINPRTLRERLRELEEEGVVTRTVIRAIPPHVEYALTEKGKALNGIFEALAQWGMDWMRPKGADLVGEELHSPSPDARGGINLTSPALGAGGRLPLRDA